MEEICRTSVVLLGLPERQPRQFMTRDSVLIQDNQAGQISILIKSLVSESKDARIRNDQISEQKQQEGED